MEVARHPLRAAQDAHTALCFPASRLTVSPRVREVVPGRRRGAGANPVMMYFDDYGFRRSGQARLVVVEPLHFAADQWAHSTFAIVAVITAGCAQNQMGHLPA
jgi:hypothetical protein